MSDNGSDVPDDVSFYPYSPLPPRFPHKSTLIYPDSSPQFAPLFPLNISRPPRSPPYPPSLPHIFTLIFSPQLRISSAYPREANSKIFHALKMDIWI